MSHVKSMLFLCMIILTMGCDGAQHNAVNVALEEKREEISPRDQGQGSPRRKVFMSRQLDLRKAIAHSSPRRSGSRDLNEKEEAVDVSKDNSSHEDSPHSLIRSKSNIFPSVQDKKENRPLLKLNL